VAYKLIADRGAPISINAPERDSIEAMAFILLGVYGLIARRYDRSV